MTDTNLSIVTPEDGEQEPWDQLPNEPDTAYRGFCIFRGMGPTRKTRIALEQYNNEAAKDATISDATWFTWSSSFGWHERVKAWDRQLERAARAIQTQAIQDMNKRHIDQARAMGRLGHASIVWWLKAAAANPDILSKINLQTAMTMVETQARIERAALVGTDKGSQEVKPSFVIIINSPQVPTITIESIATSSQDGLLTAIENTDSNLSIVDQQSNVIEGEVRELSSVLEDEEEDNE